MTLSSCKVLWLTGLSGSGKTTIAEQLSLSIPNSIVVDGDALRATTKNSSFSVQGRFTNIAKAIDTCQEHPTKTVIVALISPFRDHRDYVKQILGDRFVEVYIQCSLKECIRRDVKGLYVKALTNQITDFTGIQQLYEEPVDPEILVNTEFFSVEQCVIGILEHLD